MDRKIYRNAITAKEAEFLLNKDWAINETLGKEHASLTNVKDVPVINKLLEIIRKDFDFEIGGIKESYIRIETRGNGHRWHNDKGGYSADDTNTHMSWCQLGVSILLSDESEFTGGDTYYADMDFSHEENKIKSDRRQYDMCVHTSNVWHMVEPHEGSRTVLLMFI